MKGYANILIVRKVQFKGISDLVKKIGPLKNKSLPQPRRNFIVSDAALAAVMVAAPTCAYSTVDRAYPFLKMPEGGTTKMG